MIKDIVVNLNVGAKANPASDYAISVAATLDAHLTAIIFLFGPIVPVSRAGYVPPELADPCLSTLLSCIADFGLGPVGTGSKMILLGSH